MANAKAALPHAELRALTSVRGIAAWFVVFYHIRESVAGLDGWLLAIVARGYLAVDFFFLLSGFVLWLSWSERLRGGGLVAASRFWWRRFARIWPLHALILTGGVALALLLAASGRPDAAQFPFAELPLHYLLVQNWGFASALAWNDPAWSISVESAAYLAFPVLMLAFDWRRLPTSLLTVVALGLLVLLYFTLERAGAITLNDNIPRLGLIRCLLEFSAGTALAAIWVRLNDRRGLTIPCLMAGALCLSLFLTGAPETLMMPLTFATLLLALALAGDATPLAARPLHWFGQISYATYLCHFLLWKAFKLAFVTTLGPVGWPLIGLYLAMVLGASAALYHGVEKPAQAWLNARRWPRPPIRQTAQAGEAR
jgi:peptidoglycan/LPS O-acetylase OafA/YrhL